MQSHVSFQEGSSGTLYRGEGDAAAEEPGVKMLVFWTAVVQPQARLQAAPEADRGRESFSPPALAHTLTSAQGY